ncbi:MAG: PEP-CTERM sorting domain-containing protein [Thermoguttaceae bacterium]
MRVFNQLRGMTLCALSLCVLPIISSLAFGTLISYSDVSGTNVNYTDIQENPTRLSVPPSLDPPPTFGQPAGSDSLGFPNLSFKAASSGGSFDLADSKLSMTITAKNNTPGISAVSFTEFGDFTLVRSGLTSDPSAEAKAIGWVTVEEINGAPISPFVVIPNLSGAQFDDLFHLTDSQTSQLSMPWSGSLNFDVTDAIRDAGYNTGYATKVSLSLDNSLLAISDANSASDIQKKGVTITTNTVPEPSVIIMLALGVLGLGVWRRKN